MTETYDVVVVGGGIIAASAAQHLTAAGYRTLLAERRDYGSGTTSRTSRLQHCGLGYLSAASSSLTSFLRHPHQALQNLELTRRAMRGRAEFVASAPERVRPRNFIVPLTPDNAIPDWKVKLAFRMMQTFDGRVPLNFKLLSACEAKSCEALQGLAGLSKIRGAVRFTEYQYHWPERIVIDTIVKAREIGLDAYNYTPVTGVIRDGNDWKVTLRGPDGEREVRSRAIANCAGVWVDDVTAMTEAPATRLSTGEKGTNIAVRLPAHMRGTGLVTVTPSGAPFYLIPWGDLHYLGPSDSPGDGTAASFRATEGEIAAILDEAGKIFPGLHLTRQDVIYSWAGARPRTFSKDANSGSPTVTEHDLTDRGLPNFFVFTGGLLMTHLDAGRRLTAAISRRLKPPGATKPLDYSARPVPDGDLVTEASVSHAVLNEQARTLEDILRRRLAVGWDAGLGLEDAENAARIAAPLLGWTAEKTAGQLKEFIEDTNAQFCPAPTLPT